VFPFLWLKNYYYFSLFLEVLVLIRTSYEHVLAGIPSFRSGCRQLPFAVGAGSFAEDKSAPLALACVRALLMKRVKSAVAEKVFCMVLVPIGLLFAL